MAANFLATIGGFLVLVAPGLVWELRRERRHVRDRESAFREAGRVALASLFLHAGAGVPMWFLFMARSNAPIDLEALAMQGRTYVAAHADAVMLAAMLQLALASGIALLAEWATGRNTASAITPGTVWTHAFGHVRDADQVAWLALTLDDGTRLYGYLDRYATTAELTQRELSLRQPALQIRRPEEREARPLEDFDRIIVPGNRIRFVLTQYLPSEPPADHEEVAGEGDADPGGDGRPARTAR